MLTALIPATVLVLIAFGLVSIRFRNATDLTPRNLLGLYPYLAPLGAPTPRWRRLCVPPLGQAVPPYVVGNTIAAWRGPRTGSMPGRRVWRVIDPMSASFEADYRSLVAENPEFGTPVFWSLDEVGNTLMELA